MIDLNEVVMNDIFIKVTLKYPVKYFCFFLLLILMACGGVVETNETNIADAKFIGKDSVLVLEEKYVLKSERKGLFSDHYDRLNYTSTLLKQSITTEDKEELFVSTSSQGLYYSGIMFKPPYLSYESESDPSHGPQNHLYNIEQDGMTNIESFRQVKLLSRNNEYYLTYEDIYSLSSQTAKPIYSFPPAVYPVYFNEIDTTLLVYKDYGIYSYDVKTGLYNRLETIGANTKISHADNGEALLVCEAYSKQWYYVPVSEISKSTFPKKMIDNVPEGYAVRDINMGNKMLLLTPTNDNVITATNNELLILDFNGNIIKSIAY